MRYPKTSLADRVVSPVYSRWWILGSNIVAQVVLSKYVAAGPRESLSSSIFLFHLVGSQPLAIISCTKLHALAFAQLGILVWDIGILNCSIKKCKLAFLRSWDGALHNKKWLPANIAVKWNVQRECYVLEHAFGADSSWCYNFPANNYEPFVIVPNHRDSSLRWWCSQQSSRRNWRPIMLSRDLGIACEQISNSFRAKIDGISYDRLPFSSVNGKSNIRVPEGRLGLDKSPETPTRVWRVVQIFEYSPSKIRIFEVWITDSTRRVYGKLWLDIEYSNIRISSSQNAFHWFS